MLVPVLFLSVVFQLTAAGLALRLIRVTERRDAWLLIAGAICLMALRRGVILYHLVSGDGVPPPNVMTEGVALVVSVLMVAGIAGIAPLFAAVRRSEQAVRQSERKFRGIVEQAYEGITLIDERGIIIEWNLAQERITGLKRADVIGRPAWDVQFQMMPEKARSPERYEQIKASVQQFTVTGEAPWLNRAQDVTIRRADGELRTIQQLAFPISTDKGFMLAGFMRDVTEEVRVRNALEQSEARYRALVEQSLVGVYLFTEQGFVYVNEALARLFGYEPNEVIGRLGPLDLTVPEDRPLVLENIRQRLDGEAHAIRYVLRGLRKDGSIIHCEVFGRRIEYEGQPAVIGALVDITDRKRASEEIRRRAAHQEALHTIIATASRATDVQEMLKTALEQVMGAVDVTIGGIWTGESWIVRGVPDGFVPAVLDAGQRAGVSGQSPIVVTDWEQRLAQDPDDPLGMLMHRLGIRSTITADVLAAGQRLGGLSVASRSPREWTEDEVALVEAVGREIGVVAERLLLMATLQQTNEELRKALQAKDEMIQNVSHELRTPLTLIAGYVDLMAEGALGPLTKEQAQILRVLQESVDRLTFMVDRLILMQTLEPAMMHKEPLAVEPWLRRAVARWQQRAAMADIRLTLEVEEGLPPILADSRLLGEVIDNLLDNAIKFSPEGGEVRICAWLEEDNVVLATCDQGVGIPRHHLQRLFDRFYQVDAGTSRRFGGMGIGLALCREIVDLHGGRIWAESAGKGKGTTFYVTLPVHTAIHPL